MLSLRNFYYLFWHFDRVLRQYEVSRGVKKLWRVESNKSWHDINNCDTIFWAERHVFKLLKSWHDFLRRGTILRRIWNASKVKFQNVTRLYQLWRDFRFSKFFLFKLNQVPEIRITILESKSAILTPQKTAEGAKSSSLIHFRYVLILPLRWICVTLIETCCCETLFIMNDNLGFIQFNCS